MILKEIYKHIIGYYDGRNQYHNLDGFKFYEKLSIGKYARYKKVFYNGEFVIKSRTPIRCKCACCGKENDVKSLYHLRSNENKKYYCSSCCVKGRYLGKKANDNRIKKAIENYIKDFGEIEKNWLYEKYIVEQKSLSQISKTLTNGNINDFYRCIRYIKNKLIEYDIPIREKNEWMKIPSIRKRNIQNGARCKNISSLNNKIISILNKLNIDYEMEYILGNYRYDFYIPDKDIIIECNGDYWHCNPNIYDASFFHKHSGLTAREIWKKDETKINFAENNGYNVLIYWENEINSENFIKEVKNGLEVSTMEDQMATKRTKI